MNDGKAQHELIESGKKCAYITLSEVALHSTEGDCWIIADGFVLDISLWIQVHPGGIEKILSLKEPNAPHFSFRTHFKNTREVFERACADFEKEGKPVEVFFDKSRANGGLDRSGDPNPAFDKAFIGSVFIIGKCPDSAQK